METRDETCDKGGAWGVNIGKFHGRIGSGTCSRSGERNFGDAVMGGDRE